MLCPVAPKPERPPYSFACASSALARDRFPVRPDLCPSETNAQTVETRIANIEDNTTPFCLNMMFIAASKKMFVNAL
jgi:hypothetical protein